MHHYLAFSHSTYLKEVTTHESWQKYYENFPANLRHISNDTRKKRFFFVWFMKFPFSYFWGFEGGNIFFIESVRKKLYRNELFYISTMLTWFLLSIIFHSCEVSHMFFHFQHYDWLSFFFSFLFLSIIPSTLFLDKENISILQSHSILCVLNAVLQAGRWRRKKFNKQSFGKFFYNANGNFFLVMWKFFEKIVVSTLGVVRGCNRFEFYFLFWCSEIYFISYFLHLFSFSKICVIISNFSNFTKLFKFLNKFLINV